MTEKAILAFLHKTEPTEQWPNVTDGLKTRSNFKAGAVDGDRRR
jgi:hypothetical protein